jgi:phosphatidylethanolamine-binding protein (PEBP) family uncharacterized protein
MRKNRTITNKYAAGACSRLPRIAATLAAVSLCAVVSSTSANAAEQYTIERTLADGGQLNTIAFDGLAFLNGNLGGQSFLPPGKVADFSGFQYLRDNDPTELGHNTDFVTIVSFNVLNILTQAQIQSLIDRARDQVSAINQYAYGRFPLIKAFRRLLEGDLPQGATTLDKEAVMAASAKLYLIDGEISYDRAQLLGGIIRSMTTAQRAAMDNLKTLGGVGNWNRTLADPLDAFRLERDIKVGVMTYASEMYAWYAGSVEADTYFCPERQGTYFGSFYLKDWPAMGNPNYTINEQLTATAGQDFLKVLTPAQAALVTDLVNIQKSDLLAIVDTREAISQELRKFMTTDTIDRDAVMTLSERYGELDGAIIHAYATHFAQVYASLSAAQRASLTALVDALGYVSAPGAFLYSEPIAMPAIENTDYLFGVDGGGGSTTTFVLTSPEVGSDGKLPMDYTCDGTRATLPLAWTGAPAATQNYAVIMHHVAPDNEIKWYWILYNIPADVESLARNVTGVGTLGTNSVNNQVGYDPPCSQGPGPKTYVYTVYALSAPVTPSVPASQVTREVLLAAMSDRTLASAELPVVYERTTQTGTTFRRGDANATGTVDIADAIFVISFLFGKGPTPTCLSGADANDDGTLDISDAVKVLAHLFAAAGPLPGPFDKCGPDPTADKLTCASFAPCK